MSIEYLKRREKEITLEIEIRQDYIEKSEPSNWDEIGVGRSYVSRRRQRFASIHKSRVDSFKCELITLKKDLKEIEERLRNE